MNAREQLCSQIPLLQCLSQLEVKNLRQTPEVRQFKKGSFIFKSQDRASEMYLIKSGFMKICLDLVDGREQILYVYKSGDYVGGLNLISGQDYAYSGIALRDCEIVIISKEDFQSTLMKNNQILTKILEQSFYRIRRSEELIARLSVINADMKVAQLLIDLIRIYGTKTPDHILLNLTMNREELGSYAGLSRETLSRKLNYFEDLGYIKLLPKGQILLLDIKKLGELTL